MLSLSHKTSTFKAARLLLTAFFFCSTLAPNLISLNQAQAAVYNLPAPNSLVTLSTQYSLPMLKGLKIDPQNPLNITFIIDSADQDKISDEEAYLIIRYFLAGLTIPESDLWVNLSPYEQDRIAPQGLSETDLGKDMLSQDYFLKQLSASLTYPESDTGKEYWSSIVGAGLASAQNGQPQELSLQKIWIMPDTAEVYEHKDTALIAQASLKAMLENDYLAMQNNRSSAGGQNDAATKAMRETILPKINADVKSGKNFAQLRQMYYSLVLATWFKKKFQDSFYKNYINQNKVSGIDLNDKTSKDKIYALYCEAFKKGVYNYIKKDSTPAGKTVYRKYFSGGVACTNMKGAVAAVAVTESQQQAALPQKGAYVYTSPENPIIAAAQMDESIEKRTSPINEMPRNIRTSNKFSPIRVSDDADNGKGAVKGYKPAFLIDAKEAINDKDKVVQSAAAFALKGLGSVLDKSVTGTASGELQEERLDIATVIKGINPEALDKKISPISKNPKDVRGTNDKLNSIRESGSAAGGRNPVTADNIANSFVVMDVHGKPQGLVMDDVDNAVKGKQLAIAEVSPDWAALLKKEYPEKVYSIFISPFSEQTLGELSNEDIKDYMLARQQERSLEKYTSPEDQKKRATNAVKEIPRRNEYNAIIVNPLLRDLNVHAEYWNGDEGEKVTNEFMKAAKEAEGQGKTFILYSGPSATGKSPLWGQIQKRSDIKFERIILYTSRAMRPDEREGKDYYFRSAEFINTLGSKDDIAASDEEALRSGKLDGVKGNSRHITNDDMQSINAYLDAVKSGKTEMKSDELLSSIPGDAVYLRKALISMLNSFTASLNQFSLNDDEKKVIETVKLSNPQFDTDEILDVAAVIKEANPQALEQHIDLVKARLQSKNLPATEENILIQYKDLSGQSGSTSIFNDIAGVLDKAIDKAKLKHCLKRFKNPKLSWKDYGKAWDGIRAVLRTRPELAQQAMNGLETILMIPGLNRFACRYAVIGLMRIVQQQKVVLSQNTAIALETVLKTPGFSSDIYRNAETVILIIAQRHPDWLSQERVKLIQERARLIVERNDLSEVPSEIYSGSDHEELRGKKVAIVGDYSPNPAYAPAQARIKEVDAHLLLLPVLNYSPLFQLDAVRLEDGGNAADIVLESLKKHPKLLGEIGAERVKSILTQWNSYLSKVPLFFEAPDEDSGTAGSGVGDSYDTSPSDRAYTEDNPQYHTESISKYDIVVDAIKKVKEALLLVEEISKKIPQTPFSAAASDKSIQTPAINSGIGSETGAMASPTGGIDVRDIKVGVSPNSLPIELPGVSPDFFKHYNLKIIKREEIGQ